MATQHSNTEQIHSDSFEASVVEALETGCATLQVPLTAAQKEQLLGHLKLLAHWNKKLNLTAIVSPFDMVVQHLLDSLAINTLVRGSRILDIGSGGGFPGIPLAVVNPGYEITLLDSRGKRIEFLRYACGAIGIGNAHLVKSRVEDYRPADKFDTLVSRAFSSLPDMLQWTRALQQPGTRLIAMKGKNPEDEIALLPEAWGANVTVSQLSIPFQKAERHAVIIEF
jgi:16S rRNA (guanine527-N7)-methyltransferase